MEHKTIGNFITALRKANGLTQKDLAEKLNVSDKTVSRWERDESAPDLSLIPVIAELFGVTCDELLRGERRPPEERGPAVREDAASSKSEKLRRRLLRQTLSQYQNRTCIAIGLSVLGLLAALVGNLAFLSAVLGFLAGAAFFAVSLVCQVIFRNRAFLSVEDAELEEAALAQFRRSVIRLEQRSVGVTLAFIGFTFPLVLVDAYMGLGADSLLLFGTAGAALALLAYAVALYFINAALLKKGVYTLCEKELAVYRHDHRLKGRCAAALLTLWVLTAAVHVGVTALYGPGSVLQGTVFYDYESFVEFMEQDIPHQPYGSFEGGTTAPEEAAAPTGEVIWYDENGNVVSEEESLRRTLKDADGNVVCEYIARNESVSSIRYSPGKGTVLPITVSTHAQRQQAEAMVQVRHVVFAAVYVLEAAVVVVGYFRKRAGRTKERVPLI